MTGRGVHFSYPSRGTGCATGYAASVLILLLACGSAPPPAPATDAFPAYREAWRWPFQADSPWNLPHGDALALQAADAPCSLGVRDNGNKAWINAKEWSQPVYRAGADDPVVPVWEDDARWGDVASPENAQPSLPSWPDGDAHLLLVGPDGATVTEMWKARRRDDGGWDTDSAAANDLLGPGWGEGGVRIYGGSAMGGLWRTGEVATDARHSLALSLPVDTLSAEFVWPATRVDSSRRDEMVGPVPVGQHVALPTDFDLEQLTTEAGRALARALRDYGAYVVDHAANFALYAEPDAEDEVDPMRDDLDAIRDRLRCATNATEWTPGGPGERVQALAPDFR